MSTTEAAAAPVNPFAAAPSSKKMITLVGIWICLLGTIFQSATGSTVLPMAAAEVGGTEIYALANTVPTIISVVAMPLWGFFAVKNPAIRTPLYFASMLAGCICLFGRALAPSMPVVIGVSLFWGLPSAGLYVLGYAMIREMYDARVAGGYFGICSIMQSLGMLAGPVLGGLIIDFASWRIWCAVMGAVVLIGGLLVFMGVRPTKEECSHMAREGAFDYPGALALVIFLGCLICAISLGSSFVPFGTSLSFGLFAGAIVGLIFLVVVMRKKGDQCIVPTGAITDRNTLMFCGSCFFCNFSNMAVFFFLPSYCIYVMGCGATEAGLTTTMLSIPGLLLGPIFGRMIGKSGTARGVLSLGCIFRIVVALALLFFLAPDANIFVVYVIMLVGGIYNVTGGICFSAGPQTQLHPKIRVQGNSIIQLCQNFGGGVGSAVYMVVLGAYGIADGFPIALIIAAVTAGIALAFTLFLRKLTAEEAAGN